MGPVYSDDIGISVVALHSDRGKDAFDTIQGMLTDIVKLSEHSAFVFNESYCKSAQRHEQSESFFDRIEHGDIEGIVTDLIKNETRFCISKNVFLSSIFQRLIRVVKRILT